ncbi:hypothetical protein K466DRAFT_353173 [Polyporus arcularius HHB13444]|uniref:Uncharacterized protein n=1 Tax=Polyporus arcularius HHB13444 TaxID=1314778 RepID=A0A5C3NUQ7_9APHY|nr:hypothetical protein K466DRAFT_353173 [Polyporus arcularius HHB13444]
MRAPRFVSGDSVKSPSILLYTLTCLWRSRPCNGPHDTRMTHDGHSSTRFQPLSLYPLAASTTYLFFVSFFLFIRITPFTPEIHLYSHFNG